MFKRTITIEQAAGMLRCTNQYISILAKNGKFTYYKYDNRLVDIDYNSFARYVKSRETVARKKEAVRQIGMHLHFELAWPLTKIGKVLDGYKGLTQEAATHRGHTIVYSGGKPAFVSALANKATHEELKKLYATLSNAQKNLLHKELECWELS